MSTKKNERVSTQVMELKDLIAGPLIATIDADSLSAQRYLDYLFQIAFESYDPATGKTGKLRMLTFNYRSNDLTGSRTQSVSISVLTLIPLPLLQVQEADFDIQILDASSRQSKSSFSFNTGETTKETNDSFDGDTRLRVALAASSGGKSAHNIERNSSLTANMKVHVKMRQADVPAGLALLLNKAVNNMVEDVASENNK